jgi:hypothetical protein
MSNAVKPCLREGEESGMGEKVERRKVQAREGNDAFTKSTGRFLLEAGLGWFDQPRDFVQTGQFI